MNTIDRITGRFETAFWNEEQEVSVILTGLLRELPRHLKEEHIEAAFKAWQEAPRNADKKTLIRIEFEAIIKAIINEV